MSRAGLVYLILLFLSITLVASAPLPENLSSDIESFAVRSGDYDHALVIRSPDFDSLDDRGPPFLKERDFDVVSDNYYTREVTPPTEPLYRRSKITQRVSAAFKKAGAAIKKGFQKAGAAMKKGFQKAGAAIKKGFQKVGAAMKKGFQKAGAAIKKGFQKVGKFIKTTGAKIVKFGLKVVSAVVGAVGTVARFIPEVGPGISAALKGVSAGADAASNAIHAKLGKKLDKGMKVLNIIKDPIGAGISAAVYKAKKHK